MQAVTTIGLDIAKSIFQVHGVDAEGNVVVRRKLKRRYIVAFFQKLPPCLVGIEACASSHHWARELQALGHRVLLMPPAYVKPYVKRCLGAQCVKQAHHIANQVQDRVLLDLFRTVGLAITAHVGRHHVERSGRNSGELISGKP